MTCQDPGGRTARAVAGAAAHPWMPVSPCDDGCLPAPGTAPQVGRLRTGARLLAAAGMACVGTGLALTLPLLRTETRDRIVRAWFRCLVRAFGARLVVRGEDRLGQEGRGVLVVANHVSWLDIVALAAVQPLCMLAKKEVRRWPVVGRLAAAVGTLFVDRERLRRLPETVALVAETLRTGATIGVFPEGTTWCGRRSGPYRSAVFQAVLDAGALVRPVALRFLAEGRPTTAVAFVGEDTLWDSLLRVARLRGLVVEVEVLPVIEPAPGTTRRDLARLADQVVARATRPAGEGPWPGRSEPVVA